MLRSFGFPFRMPWGVWLTLLFVAPALAQPPGGSRFGGRGGPSEGFGGRGGPPGGAFGGRRFGDRGGDRGRGGFDPAAMLQRFDRNGNGMIDMDEREGPVNFIIGRLEQGDSGIDTSRPIPLDKITETFQQMRGGGRDGSSGRGRPGGRGGDDEEEDFLETELLIPGFGIPPELMPGPVLGFGPTAELFDVDVRPEDLQEAEERMRRYDRNRDGVLSKDEISSRWEGNPMDFDRNKDGKLTAAELAIRYARRRSGEEAQERDRDRARDRARDRDRRRERDEEIPDPYEGRRSLRLTGNPRLQDLPTWFTDRDANADGQVMMNEYTSRWSDDLVAEFFRLDVNQDGTITAREAETAADAGIAPGSAPGDRGASSPAMASARRDATGSSRSDSSRSDDSRSARSGAGAAQSAAPSELSEKYLAYAERIISRYDENKDGALASNEWKGMIIDPQPADANRDGRITKQEYAGWLQNRQK